GLLWCTNQTPLIEGSGSAQRRRGERPAQPPFLWTRRFLKRLQPIQNKQGSPMRDQLREPLSLLPRCSEPWIRISKPIEGSVKEFICRRSVPAGALSVEGPTKNKLCRTIVVGSHSSEPMIDECRLTDPSPGNDRNAIYILVCPRIIQESDILFSTKSVASGNGQSGYGNLLRCRSCYCLASSDTRSGRGLLLQALTSDSTPCVDCACYRRHRLQKI